MDDNEELKLLVQPEAQQRLEQIAQQADNLEATEPGLFAELLKQVGIIQAKTRNSLTSAELEDVREWVLSQSAERLPAGIDSTISSEEFLKSQTGISGATGPLPPPDEDGQEQELNLDRTYKRQ